MHHTPWTKKSSSTVPSDRIPPSRAPKQPARSQKAKDKQDDVPKSKEVKRFELVRDSLVKSKGIEKDQKGSCFCQARLHPLSTYTPICRQCGLILCSLHLPHYACPHCASPLLSAPARESLITSLNTQISDTIRAEEEQRKNTILEARRAAGAFPTLAGDILPPAHPVNQPHKVLSLNSKTKKVTVSSYITRPPEKPRSLMKGVDQVGHEVEPERIPPPPAEVEFVRGGSASFRLWTSYMTSAATYVPVPVVNAKPQSSRSRKKRNKAEPPNILNQGDVVASSST